MAIVCFVLAGFFAGGIWTAHRSGLPRWFVAALVAVTALALAGGVLWL